MLILASQSPRRREILGRVTDNFKILVSECDETVPSGTSPYETVRILSCRKAMKVAAEAEPNDFVIGADTVVEIDGEIYGKPNDENDAVRMLSKLSGRTHKVFTGIAVCHGGTTACDVVETSVTFRKLEENEIKAYVACREPFDKAGAYGIQGKGSAFVEGIEGDYFNVMGLPICRLVTLMKERFGVNLVTEEI